MLLFSFRFDTALTRVENSSEVKQQTEEFKSLFKTLEKYTGKQMEALEDLYYLHLTLSAQNASGLELPNWAHHYWPNGQLLNATALRYKVRNYNDELKRLYGGSWYKIPS